MTLEDIQLVTHTGTGLVTHPGTGLVTHPGTGPVTHPGIGPVTHPGTGLAQCCLTRLVGRVFSSVVMEVVL